MVWSWFDHGVIMVWSWCDHGVIMMWSWCDHGVIMMWSWCDHGVTMVWSWCDHGVIMMWSWCYRQYKTKKLGRKVYRNPGKNLQKSHIIPQNYCKYSILLKRADFWFWSTFKNKINIHFSVCCLITNCGNTVVITKCFY